MSIATAIQAAQAKVAAAYTECNAKGATMPSAANQDLAHLDDTIASIPTGGGITPAPSKDVNFYDYEGTILYSYTKAEFLALTAMPANPDRTSEGLTAQGWNWSLADAKDFVTEQGALDIGQQYITSDGKTRLYITLCQERTSIPLYIKQSISDGIEIDWGDGSAVETISGTGNVNATHTYADGGDYVIKLNPLNDCTLDFGDGSTNTIFGADVYYSLSLRRVEFGTGVTGTQNKSFFLSGGKYMIDSVVLPNECVDLRGFENVIIKHINFPSNANPYGFRGSMFKSLSVGSGVYGTNYGLAESFIGGRLCMRIRITSNNVTRSALYNKLYFDGAAFETANAYGNKTLVSVTLGSRIAKVYDYAFGNCSVLKEVHIKATTPPALVNVNAFVNTPADMKIYVPSSAVNTYKGASNWINFESQIYAEPE